MEELSLVYLCTASKESDLALDNPFRYMQCSNVQRDFSPLQLAKTARKQPYKANAVSTEQLHNYQPTNIR